MNTVVVEESPVPSAAAKGTGGPRGVAALARFEARRLLTSAPVVFSFAVYILWTVWRTRSSWDGFPALQDADRATQGGPLLVGLGVLLAADFAALRDRRRGTQEWFGTLVLPAGRRTAAHLLALLPVVLLTAVCVAAQFTWEALKPGAVGHGSPAELLVGPLTVLLLGAAGVLLARLAASVWAAPLLGVLYLFFLVLGTGPSGDTGGTAWLYPVVSTSGNSPFPSDLLGRPAAWHALYLAGVALCLAFLAVLVAARGRGVSARAGLAVALAMALTGGVAQSRGDSAELLAARERASAAPEKEQRCVTRDGSTYCAFDEWVPRADDWAGVVGRVRSLAGDPARDRPLLVRQRIEARYGLDSDSAIPASTRRNQVTVGTAWGGNRVPEFSAAVAGVLVAGSEAAAAELCDGRMVTVMWLAVGWEDNPMGTLRRVRLDDSVEGAAVVLAPTDPLSMTAGQTDVVRRLLEKDRDGVAAKARAHWGELTSPGVTTARAAELLGVPGPEKADSCEE
ncbi:ABC transporter permease [Streptomyces daghestanicus]|uniref:ABC transporter n=1 Tax=Streptomyces daghestanicus TaxID=66885 RepID=A0ABQ3Q4Z6_9ACTN|nr:ABC transporter permease [Streptomyces daghestanicus]GGU55214.1 ABC transporter [Streptomyces daghestanicus]GHI32341.1 ABC transporter [Streptomyces daghestanicus]